MQGATLETLFTANTAGFDRGIKHVKQSLGGMVTGMGKDLKKLGGDISGLGKSLTAFTAPIAGAFGFAIKSAMDFDEQITNVAAVMGLSAQESDAMGQAMLALSRDTKFSGTELAAAMYDVAGGVQNAADHMSILTASAELAEANNANLVGSTNALISTYNAFSGANVEASRVSDVLTMTVKQGVGTMDELAAVFGRTSTLASPLGIDIEELGLMFAELSKKGATFSESGTRIEGALSALLNPTKELEDAFKKMGMTQADVLTMLEDEGLIAVIQKMTDAGVDLTAVFGDKEALLGVLAIADIDPAALGTFTTNLEGATAAAQEIQATGDKFKWDTIMGDMSDLAVVVGQALAPAFGQLLSDLSPVIQGFADWAGANPELVKQIALLAFGATALGLIMIPIGTVISGLGTIATVAGGGMAILAGAVGLVLSPVTLLFTALGGLVLLFTGEGGLVGGVNRAFTALGQLGLIIGVTLMQAIQDLINSPFIVGIRTAFEGVFTAVGTVINDFIGVFETIGVAVQVLSESPFFGGIINAFTSAFNQIKSIVEGVVNAISGFLGGIGQEINRVLSSLGLLRTDLSAAQQQFAQLGEVGGAMIAGQVSNWAQSVGLSAQPTNPNRPTVTQPISPIITPQIRLPGKALGGNVMAGVPYNINETGKPETVIFPRNGIVMSNPGTYGGNNYGGGRSGGGVNIQNLYVQGVQNVNDLLDELETIKGRRSSQ